MSTLPGHDVYPVMLGRQAGRVDMGPTRFERSEPASRRVPAAKALHVTGQSTLSARLSNNHMATSRHRKTYNIPCHAHELTFSCRRRFPFLTRDLLRM